MERWRVDRVEHSMVPLLVACDDEGALVHVGLGARSADLWRHAQRHGAVLSCARTRLPASRQLAEYLAGRRRRFELPLRPLGTPFQRAAWAALERIPYGETWSYGQQAGAMGQPSAVRAVGHANGANPLPIVIPCHRVVGRDGGLTGFGGGLALKRWLLQLESPQTSLWREPAA